MQISRRKHREQTLTKFNYVRTCVLARELCLLTRQNRATLTRQDVNNCCSYISHLCKEAGCNEPSQLCKEAAETVVADEQRYLDVCKKSCLKCGESRHPTPKKQARPASQNSTVYVA